MSNSRDVDSNGLDDSNRANSPLGKSALIIGILLIGAIIAAMIYMTAPKPQRGEEKKQVRLVEVTELKRMTLRPEWLGGGEVAAAQRVQLSAQVAGRISQVEEEAIPGATLAKNHRLANIEKQDYVLQVQQQQAAVIQAQATLDLEKGQAQLAKEEYELAKSQLGSVLKNNDLVLRKPQIAAAKAGLKTAQANLALAQLQLDRTNIRMPFNGQIITRSIHRGSQVNTNSILFDLVATDEFWLQVKVPQQFLAILDMTKPVKISSGTFQREAEILHTLIEVDAIDRQAKVLISIKKPLETSTDSNAGNSTLLIGSYIDCLLFAKTIPNAYVIDNKYIKDDGSIWVVNDNKLFKRRPNVLYQSREKSWIEDGFMQGDSLLNSSLGVVTEGTAVRISADREQVQ
ncbi:MAG: efflux RND transporter periplasmic adaptor subunit [Oleispira sp.]